MRRIKTKGFCVLLVILMMLMTAGCGILEELVGKDSAASGLGQLVSTLTQSEPVSTQGAENPADGRKQTATLYFTDAQGTSLFREAREMPHTLSVGRETVQQWLLGPGEKSGLRRTVSASTTLRDINISDGVATIDLSGGFLEVADGVQAQTALYSLVNTICQFSTVNEVVLHVDGKPLESYHGILTTKLQWREDLVSSAGDGIRVESDTGTSDDGSLSPSSINIFQ
ncbi:MAG: GerMN domain-containing protein [Peptococcaceae bacterium]|nr:GerMN domain-containing protein [Peptococcaceae bacterium]